MKRKAFTLIELIIVIVVLGILATIAIVGYRAVIDRANQASAENAAKSFDRQIRAQAAFGMDGNPNMTDPRRGQLMIDMLQSSSSTGTIVKDIPDADVATASLNTNSVRVLVWNSAWIRLCSTTASCLPVGSLGPPVAGPHAIPVGSTSTTPTTTPFCLAFRKGGQTVYLGLSDRANVPGVVSVAIATACPESTPADLPTGTNYMTIGGQLFSPVTDSSW
jgi:prepilin-type N-terminal cleavage/methylation domain-containing protein